MSYRKEEIIKMSIKSPNSDTIYDSVNDLNIITETIREAEVHGLTVEVIWSAMTYLQRSKGFPCRVAIEEACEFGLNEWIK